LAGYVAAPAEFEVHIWTWSRLLHRSALTPPRTAG